MSHRTAVIVGIGPGIGLSVAQRFAREGFDLALIARNADALQTYAQQLASHSITVKTYPTDIDDISEVNRTFAQIKNDLQPINVLVVNAAIIAQPPFSTLSLDEFTHVFQVNVVGVLACIQQVIPDMQARKEGCILVTGTGAALRSIPMFPAYGATKAALRNMTLNLALELEPAGIHIAIATVYSRVLPETPYPDLIAEQYWTLYNQTSDHWDREIICTPTQITYGSPA